MIDKNTNRTKIQLSTALRQARYHLVNALRLVADAGDEAFSIEASSATLNYLNRLKTDFDEVISRRTYLSSPKILLRKTELGSFFDES